MQMRVGKPLLRMYAKHFGGKILWALPYTPGKALTSLSFFQDTDGIYVVVERTAGEPSGRIQTDLLNQAGKMLDNDVLPIATLLNNRSCSLLAYPSANGVETNCISDGKGGCLSWLDLNEPNSPASASVDLQSQYDLYEAMLKRHQHASLGGRHCQPRLLSARRAAG